MPPTLDPRPETRDPRSRCGCAVETYSRVVGYYRPVQQWNPGKKAEFADRLPFNVSDPTGVTNSLAPRPRPAGAWLRRDAWPVSEGGNG